VVIMKAVVRLGFSHPATWAARGNLAVSYGALGRFEEALKLDKRVFAEYERILGPDHPETLNSRGNLADFRVAAGVAEPVDTAEGADADRRPGPATPSGAGRRSSPEPPGAAQRS
jgi:Tetratricopeptide repeat